MERSKILLGILIALSGGIFWLLMTSGSERISFDATKFTLAVDESVDYISLQSPTEVVELKVREGDWYVNDKDLMDRSLYSVLRSMMDQLKVKRPVSKLSNSEIIENLKTTGVEVAFKSGGAEVRRFFAGGVASQSVAYFYSPEDDRAYIVEIPGYTSYVSAIFNLTSLQWRHRLLFSTPWQSLKSLSIVYPSGIKPTFEVIAEDYFPHIVGLEESKLDTGKLISYLDRFANFETNEFIDIDKFPKYDSLRNTAPVASITIEDLDINNNQILVIFPALAGDRVQLVQDGNQEWSVIEQERLKQLLPKSSAEFIK